VGPNERGKRICRAFLFVTVVLGASAAFFIIDS
jgi:hypothetical protein